MEEKNPSELPPATTTELEKPPSRGYGALLLANLAIIIAVISLILQFLLWQVHQSAEQKLLVQNTQLQQHFQQTIDTVNTRLNKGESLINNMLAQTRTEEERNENLLAQEADYLITLANYNLSFNNNIDSTIKLLQIADQKLQQINDPAVLEIRKSLANDLVALNATPKVDIPGLIAQIEAINEQINSLSPLPKLPEKSQEVTQPKKMTWKEKFYATLEKLKGVLTIRRVEEPIKPLMSPEHQVYITENIRFYLAQAQWAVLHHEPIVYQNALEHVKQSLAKYFSQDPKTQNLIRIITQLQGINVKPNLPNLSRTLDLLHNFTNTLKNKPSQNVKPSAQSFSSTPTPSARAIPS